MAPYAHSAHNCLQRSMGSALQRATGPWRTSCLQRSWRPAGGLAAGVRGCALHCSRCCSAHRRPSRTCLPHSGALAQSCTQPTFTWRYGTLAGPGNKRVQALHRDRYSMG